MSATANGLAHSQPDALASLIERLPDPQDREWYASLVAYIQALPPGDELIKVAQLFGFLTLIGRELPESLAAEQVKLREFLAKAYGALQQEVKLNGSYHEKLQERLSKLPEEIAAGVKPETIAKAMSESFRQQIVAAGLGETQALLAQSTRELQRVNSDLEKTVKPMVDKYSGVAETMESKVNALQVAAGRLQESAQSVNRKNTALLQEVRQLEWWIAPSLGLALLLAGAFLGATWEQRHSTDGVVELQNQVQRLQDAVKLLPGSLVPPARTSRNKKSS